MCDCRIALEMWEQIATNCLWDLWYFLAWLFGRLLFLALLTGVIEKRTFECFGDEVCIDAIFIDAGCGENLFKIFARISWFYKLFLWLCFGLRIGLEDGYVF